MAYLYNTHNRDVFFRRPWKKKRPPNNLSIYCLGCTTLTIELKPRIEPLIGVNYDKFGTIEERSNHRKKKLWNLGLNHLPGWQITLRIRPPLWGSSDLICLIRMLCQLDIKFVSICPASCVRTKPQSIFCQTFWGVSVSFKDHPHIYVLQFVQLPSYVLCSESVLSGHSSFQFFSKASQ